jgi:hypothetical protein
MKLEKYVEKILYVHFDDCSDFFKKEVGGRYYVN